MLIINWEETAESAGGFNAYKTKNKTDLHNRFRQKNALNDFQK